MIDALQTLIEALRDELKQYGEMLALLDQQQELVAGRAADELLHSVPERDRAKRARAPRAMSPRSKSLDGTGSRRFVLRFDSAFACELPASRQSAGR